MEEPGRLQSMESQRGRHDCSTNTFIVVTKLQCVPTQHCNLGFH